MSTRTNVAPDVVSLGVVYGLPVLEALSTAADESLVEPHEQLQELVNTHSLNGGRTTEEWDAWHARLDRFIQT